MKAIVQEHYGSLDELKLQEIIKPVPKDNEVLVEIYSASINYANFANISGKPYIARLWSGLLKPKYRIPGGDISGVVVSIGDKVKNLKTGDEVFGDISDYGYGGFAEYVCVPEEALVIKPANITFEEAAAAPQASMVALQGLRDKGEIRADKKILINGSSGGIGTFAVQIAKSYGAEVTAVCGTDNIEMVKKLGADYVMDYKKEDFTKDNKKYDLILTTAGYHPINDYKNSLTANGIYVSAGGSVKQVSESMMGSLKSEKNGKKLTNLSCKYSKSDLEYIAELMESKKVVPQIDRQFKLNDTAKALEYYGKGHSKGKVVINIK